VICNVPDEKVMMTLLHGGLLETITFLLGKQNTLLVKKGL
jgi:hypothetical protein